MLHGDPEMIQKLQSSLYFFGQIDHMIINLDDADCKIFNSSAFLSHVQLLKYSNVNVRKKNP